MLKKERFNAKYNTAMGQIPRSIERISSSTYDDSKDYTEHSGTKQMGQQVWLLTSWKHLTDLQDFLAHHLLIYFVLNIYLSCILRFITQTTNNTVVVNLCLEGVRKAKI